MIPIPFELRPSLAEEGLSISVLDADKHSDRAKEHLVRVAAQEGFAFTSPAFVPNTHKALALGEFARDRGENVHREAHAAIFHAYFAQGRDIGRADVLLEIASELGLSSAEVARAWEERVFDVRLHDFFHLGIALGLESTPAALICNELIIGSRPVEVYRQSVLRCLGAGAVVDAAEHETLT